MEKSVDHEKLGLLASSELTENMPANFTGYALRRVRLTKQNPEPMIVHSLVLCFKVNKQICIPAIEFRCSIHPV
jgi:hypothetical protein